MRKKTAFLGILVSSALVLAGAASSAPAQEPARTVLYSLEPGETIGPHLLVFSTRVTPDGALAYLTASDKNKAWFECSDGRKVSFGGIPMDFKFNPDGKTAAVLV
jgi:DNA-binding beta-propeller fold protein YncE